MPVFKKDYPEMSASALLARTDDDPCPVEPLSTNDPVKIVDGLLLNAGIEHQAVYSSKDIQILLNISRNTFTRLCDCWEPPGTPNRNPQGLQAFFAGRHRRVPHNALVAWIAENNVYDRLYS